MAQEHAVHLTLVIRKVTSRQAGSHSLEKAQRVCLDCDRRLNFWAISVAHVRQGDASV
jgi:hypothetical protein